MEELRPSVAALFVAQAARTPDARALVCGTRTLTYRELDRASDAVASDLVTRGLAPNTRIAVSLARSPDLVIALLGVLKAGSTYIPLDPNYPPQRVAHVLENAKPAAVIESLPASPPVSQSASWPAAQAAYVIYTSGSTGTPKGVVVPQSAVVNFLRSMREAPGITANDTLLAVTTISFDIAVLELFLPLTVGATVVIAREAECRDGAALVRLLEEHRVTILQATPITWQLLVESGWCKRPAVADTRHPRESGDPQPVKMLCGGEALSRKLANELLARGGELWNMYGPTETTVWSSAGRVMPGEGSPLLGPPIANTQLHVLDEGMRPVAVGATGELYIGGDGVALGYFGQPERTAQRFVASASGRLYRTGDIVRLCEQPAGCLEYIGRVDEQLKIRGFRIEPREIECTLLRHPAISQAAVVVGKAASGAAAIWAYVVPRSGDVESIDAHVHASLNALLSDFLPPYMHPNAITALAEMPRTPNGKVDRKALPPPGVAPSVATSAALDEPSARSAVERRLATVWQAVLGQPCTDPAANFFALGGHSLLAARLLVRIETEFGVRLALAALLAAPTIAQQAQLLLERDGRQYDFRRVARLNTQGSKPPLIALHNTGVYYYELARLLGPEQPVTVLQIFDPSHERAEFPQTIEAIAAEYVRLIRESQPQGPYQLLGWCVGGILAFEVARQLEGDGQQVAFVGLIDALAPGHLQRLSRRRAWLAERAYRLQLVRSDWHRVLARRQRVRDFVANRVSVKRLLRVLGRGEPPHAAAWTFENRSLSSEHYDRWLDAYLDEVAARHTPARWDGVRPLLCVSRENRGWFLDRAMGWTPFAPRGIDIVPLTGDHFTVFQGEGLKRMAAVIGRALGARRPAPLRGAGIKAACAANGLSA